MVRTVNVHEAMTHLADLLDEVEAGAEIVIAREGKPIARLVSVGGVGAREPGFWAGQVVMSEDFDETSHDVVEAFRR